ncbi:MAG: OmpH family outer membrane protein [Candidatus Sericytochromatia bacterium]
MKKIIITTVCTLFLGLNIISPSQAKAGESIGVLNTQTIIQKSSLYSALRNAEQEVSKLEENLKKELIDRQNKLQQAMQQKKSKEELEKLYKQFKSELDKKESDARKTLDSKQKNLLKLRDSLKVKVEAAVKDIAKQKGLTYVVDKQAMFFGGLDITSDVLAKIK